MWRSLGASAVAAVGAGQRVFFALQALLMAIGDGTTALVARSWGAGDTRFPLMTSFLGLIGMRCGLATLFVLLHLPVVWVYSSIIGDYMLKGSLLIWRFQSGRWKRVLPERAAAA